MKGFSVTVTALFCLLAYGCASTPKDVTRVAEALVAAECVVAEIPLTYRTGGPEKCGDKLLVINPYMSEAQWYLVTDYGRVMVLEPPPLSMREVRQIAVSEDGKLLAVVSVGEGHPILEVLDLRRVLAGEPDSSVLGGVDPYPGWVCINHWREGRLRVTSDMMLTFIRAEGGRVPMFLEVWPAEEFSLDPETGEILPLGPGGRDPARYYRERLSSQFDDVRWPATEALVYLGAYEALPELRAMRDEVEDPELREDLSSKIEELERKQREALSARSSERDDREGADSSASESAERGSKPR
jgi:hypothetical protein